MRDTRRLRFAFALAVSAAVSLASTGVVLGQEESPAPEASPRAEASPQPEVVEPSTLSILQAATDKMAGTKLKGKKYRQTIADVAPIIARYTTDGRGSGRMNGIIDLALLAREADVAGNARAAKT